MNKREVKKKNWINERIQEMCKRKKEEKENKCRNNRIKEENKKYVKSRVIGKRKKVSVGIRDKKGEKVRE